MGQDAVRTGSAMSWLDLPQLPGVGAPVPGGRLSAEPGEGRASGAAQRRRS